MMFCSVKVWNMSASHVRDDATVAIELKTFSFSTSMKMNRTVVRNSGNVWYLYLSIFNSYFTSEIV